MTEWKDKNGKPITAGMRGTLGADKRVLTVRRIRDDLAWADDGAYDDPDIESNGYSTSTTFTVKEAARRFTLRSSPLKGAPDGTDSLRVRAERALAATRDILSRTTKQRDEAMAQLAEAEARAWMGGLFATPPAMLGSGWRSFWTLHESLGRMPMAVHGDHEITLSVNGWRLAGSPLRYPTLAALVAARPEVQHVER